MNRKHLTLFLIFACWHYFLGCTTTQKTAGSLHAGSDAKTEEYIGAVVLIDGTQIVLVPHTAFYDSTTKRLSGTRAPVGATIEEVAKDNDTYQQNIRLYKRFELPADSILDVVAVSKTMFAGRQVVVVILVTLGVLIILAIAIGLASAAKQSKQSCPFIYSFDGDRYVFDAEPLGGAICEGLERTDYSPLNHLREKDGVYSLLVRNEVPETQRIDELKLVTIDHDSAHEVVGDPVGRFHLLSPPVAATRAVDDQDHDILPFVQSRERIAWQSRMPRDTTDIARTRDGLTFTIPNPTHARKAQLVVNMGTALWGSKMIKEMLELRGDSVGAWYKSINEHGDEYGKLMKFNLREELYFLKVKVREGDRWVQKQIIPAGGPFITEDRTLPIDLSHAEGDSVVIRLEPPRGFWQIDYLGLSYGKDSILPAPKEIPIQKFESPSSQNGMKLLSDADDERYIMPDVGDNFTATFAAPPQEQGTERKIFVKTRGYYDIHLPKGHTAESATIERLLDTPGAIAKYSLERYLEWNRENLLAGQRTEIR